MTLPIFTVLPDLLAALRTASNAVLIAPPGAGKTTAVAPALLSEPWCSGQILLLSPRRLAARGAAERMAEQAGEPVGQTIGYATRMDSKVSAATRIIVLTEGIFRNRIQAEPDLPGVSAVLFDEVHERSLDSDFGLALALDAQAGLRPDLRLLAMSATLDGKRFADLMAAPVLESEGKSHPLTLHHIGRKADSRIEDVMASSIRRVLAEHYEGDLLAFLPGVGEIERTADRLQGCPAEIHRLHGSLDPAEQRAAIRKGAARKVILATSIAETSLTIDGVRIVLDSGLARRARYDRAAGVTNLVTQRASQAAVTQRAGRAARQGPGIAYRLWEEAATAGLARFDSPEILEADLSSLVLDCALWGEVDPRRLAWLDPPPAAALAEARQRLADLAAVDEDGRPTPHGKVMARLPLPPRHAQILIEGARLGRAAQAAEMIMLISERGLGGNDLDLEARLDRWKREKGRRADAARRLARSLAQQLGPNAPSPTDLTAGGLISLGFPDRIARRRDPAGEQWISAGGRGFKLDPTHPLARQDWLAVADIQGAAAGARITAAAALDIATIEWLQADRIKSGTHVSFDLATRGVRAETGRRLGAITLSKGQDSHADPAAITSALLAGIRLHGLSILDWGEAAIQLRTRAYWAGVAGLDDQSLLDNLEHWLAPLLTGKRRLGEVESHALHNALCSLIGHSGIQMLMRFAPTHFNSPAGTTHIINYSAEAGPTVELRVQALFGVAEHPVIGSDRTPLILSLTSPGGHAVQTTRDLPGFWKGSWADVAKDMRGRYPKHNWPEDPASAVASLKTKRAQAKLSS